MSKKNQKRRFQNTHVLRNACFPWMSSMGLGSHVYTYLDRVCMHPYILDRVCTRTYTDTCENVCHAQQIRAIGMRILCIRVQDCFQPYDMHTFSILIITGVLYMRGHSACIRIQIRAYICTYAYIPAYMNKSHTHTHP